VIPIKPLWRVQIEHDGTCARKVAKTKKEEKTEEPLATRSFALLCVFLGLEISRFGIRDRDGSGVTGS
jgi:hypothetical protein